MSETIYTGGKGRRNGSPQSQAAFSHLRDPYGQGEDTSGSTNQAVNTGGGICARREREGGVEWRETGTLPHLSSARGAVASDCPS
jgi:hypothetical protein